MTSVRDYYKKLFCESLLKLEVDELGAIQLTRVEDIHDEEGDGYRLHIQVLRVDQMDIPPLLVFQLLDGFDPEVGDVHGHAVVKAVASVLKTSGQAGHA